jgi:glucosamine kinase
LTTFERFVLMDAGGTNIRFREVDGHGEVVREAEEVGSGGTSFTSLVAELEARASRWGLARRASAAHLVLTSRAVPWSDGGQSASLDEEAVLRLAGLIRAAMITLVPDGVAAYVGCLGASPGVVVTVGTGTIAIVLDSSLSVRRLDGWGPDLGDAGSGYRVGLEGLRAACLAADGRPGGSEPLRQAASRCFGRLEDLPQWLAAGGRVRDVARFAEEVVSAARLGDAAGGRILGLAAEEIARLASDAVSSADGGQALPVVITGGLIEAAPELAARVGACCLASCGRGVSSRGGQPTLDGCQRIALDGVPPPFVHLITQRQVSAGCPVSEPAGSK